MRFNEPEYDGIVLKIPSFFIELNGLQGILSELTQKLEDCKYSMYLPDHINNLYELNSYKDKNDIIQKAKKQKEEYIIKKENEFKNIISGDTKKLEYKRLRFSIDNSEIVTIKGRIFKWDDYVTNKLNIKSNFYNFFTNNIKNKTDFIEFITDNFRDASFYINDTDNDFIPIEDIKFSIASHYPILEISLNILHVQTDASATKNGGYTYRLTQLKKDENGNYLINGKILDGYIRKNMQLINDKKCKE